MELFDHITSIDTLFASWKRFRGGKRAKPDVQQFERNLEAELFGLRDELRSERYRHGAYEAFTITDPKLRHIHKATVRDRIVHHALYRVLDPIFNPGFIYDSYSCRIGKGTHAAVNRLERFTWRVSRNSTRPCWALKCDVRKYFDSVDHETLLEHLFRRVSDPPTQWLLREIVGSYAVSLRERERASGVIPEPNAVRHLESRNAWIPDPVLRPVEDDRSRGIPIGNLTSQLFANVYLNELDQFVKHTLRVKHYLRYTDDFVLLSPDPSYLVSLIPRIQSFLAEWLKLSLHPRKVILRRLSQGIDFLGYVVLPHHRVLRTRTKRRMLRQVTETNLSSYRGLLAHCNGFDLAGRITALAQSRTEESDQLLL